MEVVAKNLPHLQHQKSRHGTLTWYVRIRTKETGSGKRIRIRGEYGSTEFMQQYNAALSGVPLDVAPERTKAASLAWLVDRYRESSAWSKIMPSTKRQRELIFLTVLKGAKDVPYTAITSKVIRAGRERRQGTPFAANNFLKAMRALFEWATEHEYVAANPAADVKFLDSKTEGHTPWSIADVRQYEARWPDGTKERVWLHVLMYTGFRLGDASRVGWQHVKEGVVRITAEKNGAPIAIPIFPPLLRTLKTGPTGDLAWIISAYGRPFKKEAFGNSFRDAVRAAGLKDLSAHGLRKFLAAHAAECGVSEQEMQSFFGWQTNRMSLTYTKSANRDKMAVQASEKMKSFDG